MCGGWRGWERNERQRKESARLQHPQHPRLGCHIAAAAPLRFASHTKGWSIPPPCFRGGVKEERVVRAAPGNIGSRPSVCARMRCRDVNGPPISGSISMRRRGDGTPAFAA